MSELPDYLPPVVAVASVADNCYHWLFLFFLLVQAASMEAKLATLDKTSLNVSVKTLDLDWGLGLRLQESDLKSPTLELRLHSGGKPLKKDLMCPIFKHLFD